MFSNTTTVEYEKQRQFVEMQSRINPDKCGFCRSPVTMTRVMKCRRCGRQCCPRCVVVPGTPVNCRGCES